MNAKQVQVAAKVALKAGQNLMLIGPPGIGKTDVLVQVAEEATAKGGRWMITHPVCDDPSDWKGLGFPSEDRTYARFLPFGNLREMVEAKELLIVIIDDVGQAPRSVQAAMMQVLRQRSINGIKISQHVRFFLASNRKEDRAGVETILQPLLDRCIVVNMEVSDDNWRMWANQHAIHPSLIAFSKLRPQLLHLSVDKTAKKQAKAPGFSNDSTPRGWEICSRLMEDGLPKQVEYELFQGVNGEKFAAEFVAFLGVWREMPDPLEYLHNPAKELPGNESTLYALAVAVATHATKATVDNAFKLAMRLDPEFSTLMVYSMVQRDPKLAASKGIGLWAAKYQVDLGEGE